MSTGELGTATIGVVLAFSFAWWIKRRFWPVDPPPAAPPDPDVDGEDTHGRPPPAA